MLLNLSKVKQSIFPNLLVMVMLMVLDLLALRFNANFWKVKEGLGLLCYYQKGPHLGHFPFSPYTTHFLPFPFLDSPSKPDKTPLF